MRETCFAVQPQRQDAPGHAGRHFCRFQFRGAALAVLFKNLGRGRGPVKLVGKRLMPQGLDLLELFLSLRILIERLKGQAEILSQGDRKSTRLNSSHSQISYAVFCLKKKKQNICTKTS